MLTSCSSPSPQQQVEQVLNKRQQALADKDLAAYMALISPRYSGRGKTYQDIQKKAEQNFAAFSKIELTSSKRGIYLENQQAVVVQEYVLSYWLPSDMGAASALGAASARQSVKGKERLVLQQEGNAWKIIKGL